MARVTVGGRRGVVIRGGGLGGVVRDTTGQDVSPAAG